MSSNSTASNDVVFAPEMMDFFLTFNLLICGNLLAIFGIFGNVINVMSFKAEGQSDSVSITLTALAVSDLGSLVTLILLNVLSSSFWNNIDHPFEHFIILSSEVVYPSGYFMRVSGLLTAFAAFERCLCVVFPLKVKRIVTRKVAATVVILIYVLLLVCFLPYKYVTLDWWYNYRVNKTMLILYYVDNADVNLTIIYLITDMFVPYLTFFILIVCNTIIAAKLKSKAKWRSSVTGSGVKGAAEASTKAEISSKEKKVVMMLTTVSLIYVTCVAPHAAVLTALAFQSELAPFGDYFEILKLCYTFTLLLEIVTCSANILVYYNMSTKYRERVQAWFPFLARHKQPDG